MGGTVPATGSRAAVPTRHHLLPEVGVFTPGRSGVGVALDVWEAAALAGTVAHAVRERPGLLAAPLLVDEVAVTRPGPRALAPDAVAVWRAGLGELVDYLTDALAVTGRAGAREAGVHDWLGEVATLAVDSPVCATARALLWMAALECSLHAAASAVAARSLPSSMDATPDVHP